MYLNSGMSCTIRKSDTNELVGCTFFTTWKRDDDYEVVEDASLASWHNTAAEIAMEENPECPQVSEMINNRWRDLSVPTRQRKKSTC